MMLVRRIASAASASGSTTAAAATTALGHVRVLDLSRVLAGPWATQLLADLGAEVIKVEHPHGGDDTRHWGPPYLKDAHTGEAIEGEAAYYHATNRNKKSITVDVASAAGQKLLHRIALQSDVVIENFQVGKLDRYNLGYAALSKINPKLVYASITGFGQTGPRRDEPGYDFIIQAMTGFMSITGEPDGAPQKCGVAVADLLTGLYTTTAILAALDHSRRTGAGQHIDVALFDVMAAALANQGTNYLFSGKAPGRVGSSHLNVAPYDALPCSDGFIILAVGNDRQFAKACGAMDLEELIVDVRFSRNAQRVANRNPLRDILSRMLKTNTKLHWLATFRDAGVPCAPINDIAELFRDPQAIARQLQRTMPHPLAGSVKAVANPLRLSATPVVRYTHSPMLGQHNDEITQRFGPGVTAVPHRPSADSEQ